MSRGHSDKFWASYWINSQGPKIPIEITFRKKTAIVPVSKRFCAHFFSKCRNGRPRVTFVQAPQGFLGIYGESYEINWLGPKRSIETTLRNKAFVPVKKALNYFSSNWRLLQTSSIIFSGCTRYFGSFDLSD